MSGQPFWRGLAERLKAMQEAGVQVVYGALVACTVLPVLQQGGGAEAAGATGMAAAIGGHLIASHLDRWLQAVDPAQAIAADAAAEPALRAELDAMLARLDAIESAVRMLAEEDRAWFVETLRTELAGMGNLEYHEGTLVKVTMRLGRVADEVIGVKVDEMKSGHVEVDMTVDEVAPDGKSIGVEINRMG